MTAAVGQRIGWADVPVHVRTAIEVDLGSSVVEAASQPGGFSPGTADRVRLANGERVFIKAVGAALNPQTPQLHRREIAVTAALPDAAPAPRLLGSFDDGDWVALMLEDVDGRHPVLPWRQPELEAVLGMLADLAHTCTPSSLTDVPDLQVELVEDFGGWERVQADAPADLDPWVSAHLDLLTKLSRDGLGRGQRMVPPGSTHSCCSSTSSSTVEPTSTPWPRHVRCSRASTTIR